MKKQFQYDSGEVFTDLKNHLLTLANDTYGTTSYNCLHLVSKLMDFAEAALQDAGMRNELLGGDLPDRVRILLDGVGLLPAEETRRRYDMLKSMYDIFVDSESATEDHFAGGLVKSCAGTMPDDDIY